MKVPREEIYAALFAALTTAQAGLGVTSTGRKLRHIEDLSPVDFPAVYQSQGDELAQVKAQGLPTVWTFNAEWWVYVQSGDDTVALSTLLNPLLDALTTLLDPETPLTLNTLGGLAYNAKVEGTVEVVEGVLGDRALAIIPIKIVKVP